MVSISKQVEGRNADTLLCNKESLPLPPGLVGDLLNWRQEILQDAPRAEMDLGVDLHAGDEPKNKKGQPSLSPIEVSVQRGVAQSSIFRAI
jgi:hypothetical protein